MKDDSILPESWLYSAKQTLATAQQLEDRNLTMLIELAKTSNSKLKIAKERLLQARSNYRAATGALLPTINAVASKSQGRPGVVTQNRHQNIYQANFDATYEIDLFGRNTLAAKADKALILSADQQLQNVMISLIAQLQLTYLDLRYKQQQLALYSKMAAIEQQSAQIKLQAAKVGLLELERFDYSQMALIATRQILQRLEADIASSYLDILTLVGQSPGQLLELLQSDVIPSFNSQIAFDAPSIVIKNRPDVKEAEYKLLSSNLSNKAISRSIFPTMSISAMFGLQNTNLVKKATIWDMGINIAMPILNWRQINGDIENAKSEARLALINYKQIILEALADVELKIAQLNAAQNNFASNGAALAIQQKITQLMRLKKSAGRISQLALLDSQKELLTKELELLESQNELAVSTIAFYKALGLQSY